VPDGLHAKRHARDVRSIRSRVVVLSADLDDGIVGEGEPLAASWTSHNQGPRSCAMARVGLQTIPVVGAFREVHSCRLADNLIAADCRAAGPWLPALPGQPTTASGP
jgi:hypothetical protein